MFKKLKYSLLIITFFLLLNSAFTESIGDSKLTILPGNTFEFICLKDTELNYIEDGEIETIKYAYFIDESIGYRKSTGYVPLKKGDRYIVYVNSGFIQLSCDWSNFVVNKINRPAFISKHLLNNESGIFTVYSNKYYMNYSSSIKLTTKTISENARLKIENRNAKGEITESYESEYKKGTSWRTLELNETTKITVIDGEILVYGSYENYMANYSPEKDILLENINVGIEYIYDVIDPGASVTLPVDKLNSVIDKNSAVSAIQSAALGMTVEQKHSSTGIDLITLYAEEAMAQAIGKTVSGGDIVIDKISVDALQTSINDVKAAAQQTLASSGIITERKLNSDIKFKTQTTDSVKITIDPSAINTTVDNVRVQTPNYAVAFSAESIKANAGDSPLIVTITESNSKVASILLPRPMLIASRGQSMDIALMIGNGVGDYFTTMIAKAGTKTYNITFNKPVVENVKISLLPASGDTTYQAVTNSKGDAVGGKYNPVTGKLDVKVNTSDIYTVKENKKDFSDITKKSKEMKEAISILASKGIISGTSATTFSPDSTITRAEIAALIVRTLSKYDGNANGNFTDVSKSDWYFGAVGSAKKFGIMGGTSDTTFAPKVTIPKDQITAVAARVLRIEMKYKNPKDINRTLSVYTDIGSLANWSTTDISLATRENLVVKRVDGRFNPNENMTRGDAAIILYRMFMKIW